MEKDDFFIKRIRELANLSYQRDIVTFSDFLNLNEQNLVTGQAARFPVYLCTELKILFLWTLLIVF